MYLFVCSLLSVAVLGAEFDISPAGLVETCVGDDCFSSTDESLNLLQKRSRKKLSAKDIAMRTVKNVATHTDGAAVPVNPCASCYNLYGDNAPGGVCTYNYMFGYCGTSYGPIPNSWTECSANGPNGPKPVKACNPCAPCYNSFNDPYNYSPDEGTCVFNSQSGACMTPTGNNYCETPVTFKFPVTSCPGYGGVENAEAPPNPCKSCYNPDYIQGGYCIYNYDLGACTVPTEFGFPGNEFCNQQGPNGPSPVSSCTPPTTTTITTTVTTTVTTIPPTTTIAMYCENLCHEFAREAGWAKACVESGTSCGACPQCKGK